MEERNFMVESASDRKDGKVVAIVAAAGVGHRLGASLPKAFVTVGAVSYTHLTLPTTPYV